MIKSKQQWEQKPNELYVQSNIQKKRTLYNTNSSNTTFVCEFEFQIKFIRAFCAHTRKTNYEQRNERLLARFSFELPSSSNSMVTGLSTPDTSPSFHPLSLHIYPLFPSPLPTFPKCMCVCRIRILMFDFGSDQF